MLHSTRAGLRKVSESNCPSPPARSIKFAISSVVNYNRIELRAASQSAQQSSQQSSKSGSVGVGVGISFGDQTSVGVTVAISQTTLFLWLPEATSSRCR